MHSRQPVLRWEEASLGHCGGSLACNTAQCSALSPAGPPASSPTSRLPCPPSCSARANNNAMQYLATHYYAAAPEEEQEGQQDGDLKPLLREGPVKGALAAAQ